MRVTMNDQERLLRWAEPRMGVPAGMLPPESLALGVLRESDGSIEAVIVLNAFYSRQCAMHIASDGRRRWLTRGVLRAVFGYVFEFRDMIRAHAIIPTWNRRALAFVLHLGFLPEGTAKCGADDGSDGVLFGMTRDTCPWLEDDDGQKQRTQA